MTRPHTAAEPRDVTGDARVCRRCELPEPSVQIEPGRLICLACIRMKQAEWRYKHKQRVRTHNRKYMRKWRANNPGYSGRKTPLTYNPASAKKSRDKYRAKPGIREATSEYNHAYYAANRERILAQKKAKKLKVHA